MKKNIAMRIAAILFILTMISTCAFSSTFAKYVTSGSSSDTARVAKWGVVINYDNYDAFEANYNNTVISADATTEVVAPGTSGSLVGISISGTPEVAVEVKYTGVFDVTGWYIDHDGNGVYDYFYCPLEIKVGSTTFKGTNYGSDTKFEEKVNEAIAEYVATYAANTDLSGASAPVITWKWAFEGNNDAHDTMLANLAVLPTVSIEITTTITQID